VPTTSDLHPKTDIAKPAFRNVTRLATAELPVLRKQAGIATVNAYELRR
jgi:hypothetical protein